MNYKFDPTKDAWWGEDHYDNQSKLKSFFNPDLPFRFLEVGTFEGRSSVWFLDNLLTHPLSEMWCIDQEFSDNGRYNLSQHGTKVTMIEEFSDDALSRMMSTHKSYFDLIYVDGDHLAPNVILDLVLSWRLLKPGGYLLIDDFFVKATDKCFDHLRGKVPIIPPEPAMTAFRNLYRGLYDVIFTNAQMCLQKK